MSAWYGLMWSHLKYMITQIKWASNAAGLLLFCKFQACFSATQWLHTLGSVKTPALPTLILPPSWWLCFLFHLEIGIKRPAQILLSIYPPSKFHIPRSYLFPQKNYPFSHWKPIFQCTFDPRPSYLFTDITGILFYSKVSFLDILLDNSLQHTAMMLHGYMML